MTESDAAVLPHIERILDAARIAPSRHNLQPWRFVVEGDAVSFQVNPERDPSPAGAGGRMAAIAVGAALECALLRAGRMGATVRFAPARPGALVTVAIAPPRRDAEPDKALLRRATNRRLYDGRPFDDATFAWLQQATPPLDDTRTLWFGRERVRTLGPLVEEGEALFYADERIREGVLQGLRFDVRDNEEVQSGQSLGSLELSSSERLTLDAFRRTPQDRLIAMGAFEKMGAHARRLMESASGLCVIVARGSDPSADVAVGRCMQRAWLALTRRGLVAQPFSAIAVLETLLERGELDERSGAPAGHVERVTALSAACRAAIPSVDKGARIALLMRVGNAPPPTTLARRLPLTESLTAPSS